MSLGHAVQLYKLLSFIADSSVLLKENYKKALESTIITYISKPPHETWETCGYLRSGKPGSFS